MIHQSASAQASADFVFGTFATDTLRLARLRAERRGLVHAQRLTPPDPQPGEPVQIHVSVGPDIAADMVVCYYTIGGSEPHGERGHARVGQVVPLTRTHIEWDTLVWGYVAHWSAVLPAQAKGTLVRYRIEAWSEHGPSQWAREIAGVVGGDPPADLDTADADLFQIPDSPPLWPVRRQGTYAYHVDQQQVPGWLRDAVIYHIFVDRFAPDAGQSFRSPESLSGFYGGTLRGILERLEYLSELGITCLWLSPIFVSPSHHGYDSTDYGTIEPRLGTTADLQALIAAAHARGIRILLDYVVNHVSNAHPIFQQALADRSSQAAEWFTFTHWPDQYLSFFGVAGLPQINSDAAPARHYMIEQAQFWLAQGIDGFRLDYANGPSHAFWSEFRAATRTIRADSVTIGEIVDTPTLQKSYLGRLDGCLDFILMQALRQFFAFGTLSASAFDSFLQRHLAYFSGDFVLPSFLDNHDMNRFLWVVGGDTRRLKLAALCQFSLPHPPIIYYGTEVGLSQAHDVRRPDGSGYAEEARGPMRWADQDADLHSFYQQLIAIRRSVPEIWRGQHHALVIDDANGIYAYRCAAGQHTAVIALNVSAQRQIVHLPEHASYHLALTSDSTSELHEATCVLGPCAGVLIWEDPTTAG
jgi:glycosidase